ncbi:MAG: HAD-IA family hydrolase, partial [Nanoarchaeota archaeon]|nr:HAD-IA family hydrolase [Nanoarchaeota archaeon]
KELEIKPRKGFLEFFHEVRTMGIKCTIGSLTNREQALTLLEKSGIGKLFGYENIVLREDVQNPKPSPDVWIATARKANVEPRQQLIFEDSPRGIQGAICIGAYCIGMPIYNRPDTIQELVKEGAQRVFMCWSEINPQKLIENVNEERFSG